MFPVVSHYGQAHSSADTECANKCLRGVMGMFGTHGRCMSVVATDCNMDAQQGMNQYALGGAHKAQFV